MSRHCPALEKWLNESRFRPYRTTYLSPQSQNEMIEVLGSSIQRNIISEIKNAEFFSIMADTTPDVSRDL